MFIIVQCKIVSPSVLLCLVRPEDQLSAHVHRENKIFLEGAIYRKVTINFFGCGVCKQASSSMYCKDMIAETYQKSIEGDTGK